MAISGPSTLVTEAGALIAEAGGSVVDVAITAALVATCTEPGICSPGGGGFLTIDVPGSEPLVVDGYMTYPGLGFSGEKVSNEIWMEYGGGVTTVVGAGTIGVPGAFAGYGIAHERFGSVPWAEIMEVAAETVDGGFPLSVAAYNYLIHSGPPIFSADGASRGAVFDGDRLKNAGENVEFVGLAETLRYIGAEGASVLYTGDLGKAIIADLSERGSDLTRQDLAQYRPVVRRPLTMKYRGWDLDINPPPAVGGVTIALALGSVDNDEEADSGDWATALVGAFESRSLDLQPGPGFEDAAERVLISAGMRSPSTISIAAVDDQGGAVAASFSAGYGSGVIPAGTGILMNNAVGEIELAGADGGVSGSRMMSNMAPMVARKGADVVALGSPGADRITSALVSTMASLARGMELRESIEQPRVHPEFGDWGVRIATEPGVEVGAMRYPTRPFDDLHMYFGGVNGAAFEGGHLHGHADSRRHGSAVTTH
jgi:gamma-glutamyltranspeptidase/glutathione hydrolase